MANKVKRNRRASLRGWWHVLPFLLGPIALLLTFAHWETERLHNQYERIDRMRTIDTLSKEIKQLRDSDRSLTRIELMDEKAPTWQLREPDPNQIIIVPPIAIEQALDRLAEHRPEAEAVEDDARNVLVRIEYEVAEDDDWRPGTTAAEMSLVEYEQDSTD
jgi:hypothetical protein